MDTNQLVELAKIIAGEATFKYDHPFLFADVKVECTFHNSPGRSMRGTCTYTAQIGNVSVDGATMDAAMKSLHEYLLAAKAV